MIDAHAWWRMGDKSYSQQTVEQLARDSQAYKPTWFEEAVPPDDHAALKQLRDTGLVPVASGEHEPDESSFMDLIETGSVDYVQMDVCCQGGFEMGRRVFEATARHGLRFAFHCWGTLLEVIAAGTARDLLGRGRHRVAGIPLSRQPRQARHVPVPRGG